MEALLQRLEACTARLEAYEARQGAAAPAALGARPSTSAAPAAPSAIGGQQAALAAYDALLQTQLKALTGAAEPLGRLVEALTAAVAEAFTATRAVLAAAPHSRKPSDTELQALLRPISDAVSRAGALAGERACPRLHGQAVSEALGAFAWLAYSGPSCGMAAPAQHISETWQAAEFYSNKLLMEFRNKDEAQVLWARGLKELMTALQQLVRSHYPTGIAWNPNGVAPSEAAAAAAAGAANGPASAPKPAANAPKARPPPPPPPPPPGYLFKERPGNGGSGGANGAASSAGASAGGGDMQAVLKQLAGAGTGGLRKVTDDMKAKNRSDRSGAVPSPAPPSSAAAAAAAPKAGAAPRGVAPSGPPRIELEKERKWVVEHQSGNREIVIEATSAKQVVYIYGCSDSVVQVRGKVNTISIDACSRTGVVFEDVIAACEVVNCKSMQVQCTGSVPTMSVEKCDGFKLFVPEATAANADFQIVTAMTSELNIVVVPASQEADSQEFAVPEQFVSSFQGGKLVTVAAAHSGA